MMDMEARLRRLEDRAALDDLVVRYFLAADSDNLESLGACFTEGASFASSGVIDARGRQGIQDFMAASRAHMGLTVHTPNFTLYDFTDADNVSGLVGAHLELVLAGQSLFGVVRYQDDYIRSNDGWRIARRDMRTVHIGPWADVGDTLKSDFPVRWPGAEPRPSDR